MHPRTLPLALALALLATACTSPGEPRTGEAGTPAAQQAHPAATPFAGRWKVDPKKLADLYPDDPGTLAAELGRGHEYLIDIDADGTALFRTHDGDWFIRWTTDGDTLLSAEQEHQPQGISIQLINDTTTLVTADGLTPGYGKSGMFDRDANGNLLRPPGYPLMSDGPVVRITPANVEGEWRFSYERTFSAIRSARDEIAAFAGRDGYRERQTIEEELKNQLTEGPPTITIHATNPRATCAATPEAKSGEVGQATVTWGSRKDQSTFSLWHDTVVMYAMDGWHGYKPNLSFLRVVDGRVVMDYRGIPLVFERTR